MSAGRAAVADRHRWAADAMVLRPDDRVLEVGCGHGVAAGLVCDRLTGRGTLTALDRSAAMADAARRRNRAHVEAGRLDVRQLNLVDADFTEGSFDVVFAAHVAALWRGPSPEAARVGPWLVPGTGRLLLFAQPLDAARVEREAEGIAAGVARAGLAVTGVRTGATRPRTTVCVSAVAR